MLVVKAVYNVLISIKVLNGNFFSICHFLVIGKNTCSQKAHFCTTIKAALFVFTSPVLFHNTVYFSAWLNIFP